MTTAGADVPPEDNEAAPEEIAGIRPETVRAIAEALADNRLDAVHELIASMHSADVADLLQDLRPEERGYLVDILRTRFDADILAELDETVREEVLQHLDPGEVVDAVTALDSDDAVQIIEDLDEADRQRILQALPAPDRALLEEGLTYPEDSAGRLMQRELVAVPAYWSVGETIDYLRASDDLPDDFYDIFVVDPTHNPLGTIPLSRILRTRRPVPVNELAETELRKVPVEMDQEEVAFLFRQYGLVSAPVVDAAGRLVGVITVDDIVHVIDEEAEEDIMRLGGVAADDLYRAALATTKSRFSWLVVNLATAVIASVVIGFFEATIQQIVALAVLMPIVASMGGNAGTQTLTVSVRALAMRELTPSTALRVITKEVLVGGANGVLFAVFAGVVAWLWFNDPAIGSVIAAAMMVNMLVAGFAGTVIPLGLQRIGVDPAIASAVVLTTITDIVGFFAFLGLAALFLL